MSKEDDSKKKEELEAMKLALEQQKLDAMKQNMEMQQKQLMQ
mgnify:CR=1 FL=1